MADEEISGSVDAAKEATAWVKTRGGTMTRGWTDGSDAEFTGRGFAEFAVLG